MEAKIMLHANPGAYAATVVAGMVIIGFTLGTILDRVMRLFGLQIEQVRKP